MTETADELIVMARAAMHDERLSDGALYGKLADAIERLQAERNSLFITNGELANYLGGSNLKMREALQQIIRYADRSTDPAIISTARAAIAEATGGEP